MGWLVGHGGARGEQGLGQCLPPEDAIEATRLAVSPEPVSAQRLELERSQYAVRRAEDRPLDAPAGALRSRPDVDYAPHGPRSGRRNQRRGSSAPWSRMRSCSWRAPGVTTAVSFGSGSRTSGTFTFLALARGSR